MSLFLSSEVDLMTSRQKKMLHGKWPLIKVIYWSKGYLNSQQWKYAIWTGNFWYSSQQLTKRKGQQQITASESLAKGPGLFHTLHKDFHDTDYLITYLLSE